jgi:DNA-binding NarL/FixJ family response regulator
MIEPTRVLVADDEPLIRLMLRAALNRQPDLTLVGEAEDGAEALALATELRPDVVVLDISMPELDGLEVTRRLRADTNPCLILIFSSASGSEASALDAGADRFMDKAGGVADAVDAVLALSAQRALEG